MRFGVCASPDRLPLLEAAGYDYIELNFSKVSTASETDFAMMRDAIQASPLRAETFNSFFPGDMVLYTDDALERISAYASVGFARAASLGGDVAVIGSAKARTFPEGTDPACCAARFVQILRICGDAAQANGMRVAIEPLQASECGYINTVAEALTVCRAADHPAVGVLADFFHVWCSGETFDAIAEAGERLFHLHIARPDPDRAIPTAADRAGCRPWAELINRIDYRGRMSLEGKMNPDFSTAITAARPILDMFSGK